MCLCIYSRYAHTNVLRPEADRVAKVLPVLKPKVELALKALEEVMPRAVYLCVFMYL